MQRSPVFIVGSTRSGTSALVDALYAAGYTGYREGNFLTLLTAIGNAVDRKFAASANGNPEVMISLIDRDRLKYDIGRVFKRTVEDVQRGTPWFDKTGNPDMIEAIPQLLALWPESAFIFAKRRGIENVLSRVIKFSRNDFTQHCIGWARNMRAWRDTRPLLAPQCYIEIDQHDMVTHPGETGVALSMFLSNNETAAPLIAAALASTRPQETRPGTASRVVALGDTGWSEAQQQIFVQHCGGEMQAFGYSLDGSYRLNLEGVL